MPSVSLKSKITTSWSARSGLMTRTISRAEAIEYRPRSDSSPTRARNGSASGGSSPSGKSTMSSSGVERV